MKKTVLIFSFLILFFGGFAVFENAKYNDGKLHVIFCNVGQGNGVFIRTPGRKNFLIDAGPDDKIIKCLERHMPFWDKTISAAFLTHPHLDHFAGLNFVIKRYSLLSFVTEDLSNKSVSFQALMDNIRSRNLKIIYVFSGDSFKLKDGTSLLILGPSYEYLDKTSPGRNIQESGEFGSLIVLLRFGSFSVLFTGDSQTEGLVQALGTEAGETDVLEVPHHGSKTGLNDKILSSLEPKLAVISAGKKNRYGHPSPFTLSLLKNFHIKTLRTDLSGDIEVVSDGESFGIKPN
ncbi:MAG: hypothetical protein A2958_00175 [Candidatus Levybacteria bacterium RIFCSPLOWO2_01_FULL_38_13]|nr:MAG: hypothetical protein A2629_02260 [Candidatus Levybacteria bacterium RIFCSPHIGHO2_01_FULL_41_15]OGH34956.1 MAG: hypothetical protein A2958_00175 [Candidatus Levybacteria bacterium RIFCSPLOWO2_01_FULL_38_13]